MKKHIVILILVCISTFADAQLLNMGFEQYSNLPANLGQWQVVQGWGNAGSSVASPDYYHYSGGVFADLPETPMAMVDAYEGQGIMGLMVCGKTSTNTREYLSTQFSSPLEVGKKYLVSFKLTNGDKTLTSYAGLGVDHIGLLFSTNAVTQNGQDPINGNPQYSIDTVFYSRDWETVHFLLTADQPYSHMTFGLFGDDSDKNIVIAKGSDPQFAYYFLDDFYLAIAPANYDPNRPLPDKGDGKPEGKPTPRPNANYSYERPFYIPNTFTPNGDGDNEDFRPVASTIDEWELEIYTKWGERVFYTSDEEKGWDGTFNNKSCDDGSYVWQVSYSVMQGESLKHKELRGIVNLVR